MSERRCKAHHRCHHDHHERNCVVATQQLHGGHFGLCDGSENVLYQSLLHRPIDATVSMSNLDGSTCPSTFHLNLGDGSVYTETVPPSTSVARTVRNLKTIVAECGSQSETSVCDVHADGYVSYCLHNDDCKHHVCAETDQDFDAYYNNPDACDGTEVVLYQALIKPYPAATFTLNNYFGLCPVTFTVTLDRGEVMEETILPRQYKSYTVKHLKKIVGRCAAMGDACNMSVYGTVSYCL